MTSFRPDQTSLIAHTFTSTRPIGRANARTVSSVISVGTFEVRFGHDTQIVAVSRIAARIRTSSLSNAVLRSLKIWTISVVALTWLSNLTFEGNGASHFR